MLHYNTKIFYAILYPCVRSELELGATYGFVLLLHVELFVTFILVRIIQVSLLQLLRVHVGVEVGHDGEDDADAQQEGSKEQELYPLQLKKTQKNIY